MIAADDSWFIRFPDGRVIRAANSIVVRQNIQQRQLVPGCMVRRSGEDTWQPIERVREFAELLGVTSGGLDSDPQASRRSIDDESGVMAAPPVGVSSRLDPRRLRTTDVRPVLQDLLAALNTALTRRKLIAAVLLTGLCGAILTAAHVTATLSPAAPRLT